MWPRLSHSTPDTQFRVGSSLQAGLYARPPFSPTTTPIPVTINLSPTRKDTTKSPLAVATGKQDVREMYREFLKWWPDYGYTGRTDLVTRLAQDCYHGSEVPQLTEPSKTTSLWFFVFRARDYAQSKTISRRSFYKLDNIPPPLTLI